MKEIMSMQEYFDTWDKDEVSKLTHERKVDIYNRHKLRKTVIHRDHDKCMARDCAFSESALTVHHVKHKRNGGEDKPRNCVTLCKAHHKRFNEGKRLEIGEYPWLPDHIKGKIFQLHVGIDKERNPDKYINWKEKKAEMRVFRKEIKSEWYYLKGEDGWLRLLALFHWLNGNANSRQVV